jgi:hypothetical protein
MSGLKADGQGPVPFCRDRCQAAGQRLSRAGNAGMPAQHTDRNERSWTMCAYSYGSKGQADLRPDDGYRGCFGPRSLGRDVQMVIRGRRITTILLVQVLEFGVREIETSCARYGGALRAVTRAVSRSGSGQMPTVQLERFRRQDISNDHLEAALVKRRAWPQAFSTSRRCCDRPSGRSHVATAPETTSWRTSSAPWPRTIRRLERRTTPGPDAAGSLSQRPAGP